MTNEQQYKPNNQASNNEDSREKKNTLHISLALIVILIPLNILYIYLIIQGQNPLLYFAFGASFFLTIMAGVANRLSRQNRETSAALILIFGIAIAGFVTSGTISGLGVLLGVSSLIVISLVSGLALKPQYRGWGILIGLVSTVAAVLIDTYGRFERLDLPILQSFVPAIAGAVILTYLFFIIREFSNYPLRTKLILSFLLVAIITLGTTAIISNNSNRARLIENAGESLTAETRSRALLVGEILSKEIQGLQAFGLSKVVQDKVEITNLTYFGKSEVTIQAELQNLDEEWRAASDTDAIVNDVLNDDIASELREYRDTFPENVEVFVTDRYGANVSATNRTSDYYQADEDWWQAAYNHGDGAVYIGQPAYDESSATYATVIAIPLYAHNTQQIVGILRSTLEMSAITTILRSTDLGDTGQIHLYVKDGKQIPLEGIELTAGDPVALSLSLDIPNYIDGAYDGVPSLISRAPVSTLNQKSAATIRSLGWSLVAQQNRDEVLFQIRKQAQSTTLISILLLGAVALSAFFASLVIAKPLQSLIEVTEQITAGNLNMRVNISSQDEIGILANSFNRMADNLRLNLVELEQRVAERTTDLEVARHQSDKRAIELISIGEISKIITSEQKLENLLTLVTRLVSERFNFYHAGIFLIDETRQFAVLQAANSEGGKIMLKRAHKLGVGASGIVGYVAKFGTPRIALDVGIDAVYFNNPDLPNTRSEMALPLKIRDVTIGILDVQSEKPGAFTDETVKTLSILADQIAIAIENARLFAQTQQALNESQALYRQNLNQGWATFSREEAMIGYQQSIIGGKKVTQPVMSEEIQQAMNRGDVLVVNTDGASKEPAIVVPIKIRGQIIGVINIKAPVQDRQWTSNEIGLAEAISERLSLALENARLIQESQRQVIKEQTIGEVTGKIGSSINLQNVLQTAVEELGRSMPGSEVVIKFQGGTMDSGQGVE